MRRSLLVVAVLCAVAAAQAAAVHPAHSHDNLSQHCCRLCHVDPLPFLEEGGLVSFAPVLAVLWTGRPDTAEKPSEAPVFPRYSRGPPA